ncbi:MAG: hypothetical protein QXY45_00200 [Candidatus Aenigmatarchaeota archaeon]
MRKTIFSFAIVLTLFLSGCIDQGTVVCGDEGLVIDDYQVNPIEKLYPGYTTTITFWLENKGERDAENVVVDFFDLQGFEIVDITCQGGSISGNGCIIPKIETYERCWGDRKKVSVTLKVPDIKDIFSSSTVSFSVSYKYSGSSSTTFPIYKTSYFSEKVGKKMSTKTSGPIEFQIKPDFLLKKIEKGKEEQVTEWLEEGQRFSVQILIIPTKNQNKGDFVKIDDYHVSYEYVKPLGVCEFNDPNIKIEYPMKEPLKCDMMANENINQDWVSGRISVDYSYTYTTIIKQDFNIEKT